jgi:membrane associated rhomboid family serine protease
VRFGPPQTPDVIKGLLIANIGVFLLQGFAGFPSAALSVIPVAFWQGGYVWQPATYMWLHGSPMHLLFNMFALWMFGSQVAGYWGTKQFLRFYILCGIGAGLVIASWPGLLMLFGVQASAWAIPTLGASGAVYGVLLAYSFLWPDRTIMLLFPPIPLKALYFIPFLFVMELLMGPSNTSHVGHLGGVVVGFLLLRRMGVGPRMGLERLRYRWRRHKMRRNLRAVRDEDARRRDERTYH